VARHATVRFGGVEAAWQAAYTTAYTTGNYAPADNWYDTYTGRTSTETLLDLGNQVTVTTSFLTTNASSNPTYVFQEGGRWIIQDVHCSNFRITSTGGLPLTIRQCDIQRQGQIFNYCIHSPSSSPVHNIIVDHCTIDGEGVPDDATGNAFAVYMPSNNYVDDDTVVRYCKILGFQSGVHGVYGTSMDYCLTSDTHYFTESHNTSASFRGGHSRAYRNRVRPGATGSSGINFYAEVSPGDDPEGYDFVYCIENMIHATEATVTVQFPDEDDPSILFSDPFAGQTRVCTGNIVDQRFSNPGNWTPPGGSIGSLFEGSGISGNIHWDGSEADDGSAP
jgi:hypothetical protein